jgi:predicted DNA-binding transcriptional regulator YafY
MAVDVLSRFHGLPQFDWVKDISLKLENEFDLSGMNKNVISFDSNNEFTGLHWIDKLIEHTLLSNTIVLRYKPFKEAEKKRIVHPYYLKQYNKRWFLLDTMTKKNKYRFSRLTES